MYNFEIYFIMLVYLYNICIKVYVLFFCFDTRCARQLVIRQLVSHDRQCRPRPEIPNRLNTTQKWLQSHLPVRSAQPAQPHWRKRTFNLSAIAAVCQVQVQLARARSRLRSRASQHLT